MPKNSVDFSNDRTPEVFVNQMFDNISPGGEVYLRNWYDIRLDDCLTCNDFLVKMKWDINSLDFLIANYKMRKKSAACMLG